MSAVRVLTLGDLERRVSLDVAPDISLAGRSALVAQLWALADDVGVLRRNGAAGWLCDRAGGRIDVCLNITSPSAAELVRAGIDVDEALEIAEARGERLRRLTGEAW